MLRRQWSLNELLHDHNLIGGDVANHDHEFDEVKWIRASEAVAMLTYDGEKNLVVEAARKLGEPIEA